MERYRIERDSLGEKEVPAEAYYGIQSERARENFEISGLSMDRYAEFIYGIAAVKQAAARANFICGGLSKEVGDAIEQASQEVMDGKMYGQFPMDIFQGGGGTSANMNVNEVIANRANELITGQKGYEVVHPNTHVNMGQSTNDVIPAAMKIACYEYLEKLEESAKYLEVALDNKADEFKDVVKMGRTCIQDALPVTLGQEFSGYYALVKRRRKNIATLKQKCCTLPLGGTAVGTKVSVRSGYIDAAYVELSKILGREVQVDANLFDGLQNADAYIDFSAGIKALAAGVSKIATDLRMMSSGPNTGLQEVELPSVQPGSSIMPGKINPVMPELINQVCYQVCGNDLTITMACEGGELDLNVWEPVIIKCMAESTALLSNSVRLFTEKCINGIKANVEYCRKESEKSIALSTVIATLIDYPTGSKVAKKAVAEGLSIREVCINEKLLTPEQADVLLDPMLLTDGELFAKKIAEYQNKVNE